jgi:hypothetical protein
MGKPTTILIYRGSLSDVTNFPEGFKYQVLDLDSDTAEKQVDEETLAQIPDITQEQEIKSIVEELKEYFKKYPVKDKLEFLTEILEENGQSDWYKKAIREIKNYLEEK